MFEHYYFLFTITIVLPMNSLEATVVERTLQMSIYPPPVSDDYYYRITIYCNKHNSGSVEQGTPSIQQKFIAEHDEHGKKKAEKNVQEGQFVSENAHHQNSATKAMMTISAANNSKNFVEQNKIKFEFKIYKNSNPNLKECQNNEVFIKILKILVDGSVRLKKEELLKLETMTIDQFEQTNRLDYDFEVEYCKTFHIVSHMDKQPFDFIVRFPKASGMTSQGFMQKQNFVVYSTQLIGPSVQVTVPITKEHKISERRGEIEIKINYKVYWISDEIWTNFDSFVIDFHKTKVSPMHDETTNWNNKMRGCGGTFSIGQGSAEIKTEATAGKQRALLRAQRPNASQEMKQQQPLVVKKKHSMLTNGKHCQ